MTTNNIYTMEDWQRDRTLSPAVGQLVADDVVWELIDCMPPAYWRGGVFQVGEAYSHEQETGKALYATFVEVEKGKTWRYMGHCRRSETTARKCWGE